MKKVVWASIGLISVTPILFIYLTITNSKDCSQLTIDTYEYYSGINIPEVDYVICNYDDDLETRISVYDLKGDMNLGRFKLTESKKAIAIFKGMTFLNQTEQPKARNIYLATGEKNGTNWAFAVDIDSQRIWTELNY